MGGSYFRGGWIKKIGLAVPVWNPGITKKQAVDIERVQKLAFRIILQDKYVNYELACQKFATDTLENRRTRLCYRFAVKNSKSDHSFFMKTSAILVDSERAVFLTLLDY